MSAVIYTYGGGQMLYSIFNGIVMIFNHSETKSIINLMTILGLSWAAIQGIKQNSPLPKIHWFVKYILITSLAIMPKSTLYVTDTVYKSKNKVDNLPIGLVLPATMISSIGHSITLLFDQAFSTVGNIEYSKYGQNFGASLISQARNFKIQDPIFRENMESFIDNCVLTDVMIGRKYSISEMRNSKNLWGLIKANASNIKMFNYREAKNGRSLKTCKDGATSLENSWNTDTVLLGERFAGTIFGSYGKEVKENIENKNQESLGNTFKANLGVVTQFYSKQTDATNVLKQIMMINAMNDIPLSYGAVRARQGQHESWYISGQLARETLPVMHSIFAGLIYASFILILGLLVLPNGMSIFGTYLGLLVWIESWPPLFAVLNFMINCSSKYIGGNIGDITMNNASQIITNQNIISVVASGLMIALPYISYNLFKGGAGAFVHLSGQLMSAGQSAASSMAQEITTGNRSFDNKTIASSQWFNNSGFKTDLNSSFRSGHQEYALSDGTIVKESPAGDTVFHAGPGITTSVGSRSMNMSDTMSSSMHQSLSFEKSLLDSKQVEYAHTEQSMHRQASDFVARLASGEASGQHYSYSDNSSSGDTLTKIVENTKDLHERYGYSWQQASEMSVNGHLGLKFGKSGDGGPGAGIGPVTDAAPKSVLSKIEDFILKPSVVGDVGVGGRLSASNQNEQGISEQYGASNKQLVSKNVEDIARAARDIQFNNNQSNEQSLADSLTGSYERTKQLRDSISVHEQNIDRYQSSIDTSQSHSFSSSDEMYHRELKYIADQKDKYGFKYGMHNAQKIIEQGGETYEELHKSFVSKTVSTLQRMPSYDFNFDDRAKEKIASSVTNDDYEVVKSKSSEVANVSELAKGKAHQMMATNHNQIDEEQNQIINKGKDLQDKSNKEEIKRSGFFTDNIGKKKNKNDAFED